MSGLASFPAERDSSAAAVAAAAAAAAASATAPALQPARRNMLLVDGSRRSSPTGSEPNSNTPLGDASDTWMMPDGKPAARPRHRLDLNSVSLALKPESGTAVNGFQNSMPLPAPALSAPSSTETRISYMPAPATMPTVQYECADTDKPPPGCAPDAIKLFVGSIPKSCTESQLLPFFETIGKVVDLVVVRDRVTRESKGSAFLWYATRAHAEQAILQFNLRHVLHDPTGEQNRPLVLRRAKSRAKPTVMPASSPASADFGDHHSAHSLPPGFAEHAAYLQQHQRNNGMGQYQNLNHLMGHPGAPQRLPPNFYQRGQEGGYPGDGGYHQGSDQMLHGSNGQMGIDSVMMALRGMHMGNQQQQQQQESNEVSMSLALSWPQLSVMKDYMHGVQGISGAKLAITAADAPGVFCMTASGMASQVQAARDLLLTVLHRA